MYSVTESGTHLIGQKTHLLDLLAQLPPSTSEQIAQTAGLHERYVREWLAAMVTGRIKEAGFTQLEVKHVEADFLNSYYIASRSA